MPSPLGALPRNVDTLYVSCHSCSRGRLTLVAILTTSTRCARNPGQELGRVGWEPRSVAWLWRAGRSGRNRLGKAKHPRPARLSRACPYVSPEGQRVRTYPRSWPGGLQPWLPRSLAATLSRFHWQSPGRRFDGEPCLEPAGCGRSRVSSWDGRRLPVGCSSIAETAVYNRTQPEKPEV